MLSKIKVLALSGVAFVGLFVALGGMQPMSFGSLYQPERPQDYR